RVGTREIPRREILGEELVDGRQEVVDVLPGGLYVLQGALVVIVGCTHERATQPRQSKDRAAAASWHDRAAHKRQVLMAQGDVSAATGPDHWQLGLVMELFGAQFVGPHTGRVDHVL